jgi:hypothetical protein
MAPSNITPAGTASSLVKLITMRTEMTMQKTIVKRSQPREQARAAERKGVVLTAHEAELRLVIATQEKRRRESGELKSNGGEGTTSRTVSMYSQSNISFTSSRSSIDTGSSRDSGYFSDSNHYDTRERVLYRHEYKAGMIIHAKHVERHIDQYATEGKNESYTKDGTLAFEKGRKYVVLKVRPTHAILLPIFTHNGQGLDNKWCKNNYASIREIDNEQYAEPSESDNPILWANSINKHGSAYNRMSNTTSVQVDAPKDHKYCWPARIMGYLEPESLADLCKLFLRALISNDDNDDEEEYLQSPSSCGSSYYHGRSWSSSYGSDDLLDSYRPTYDERDSRRSSDESDLFDRRTSDDSRYSRPSSYNSSSSRGSYRPDRWHHQ